MSVNAWAWPALVSSLALLWVLAFADPKRLRLARMPQRLSQGQRRWLSVFTLVPGAALVFAGLWPAFLLWLGAVLVGGWLLALLFAEPLTSN